MISIAISGASGRMGKEVVKSLYDNNHTCISNAFVSPNSNNLGIDIGEIAGIGKTGITCTDKFSDNFDVLIDFSSICSSLSVLPKLVNSNKPIVLCTTGFSTSQQEEINQASKSIPLLQASNTSLGITLLLQLVKYAATRLKNVDIEIIEAHHRNKVDAPSGTAITIGNTISKALNTNTDDAIYTRHGNTGVRPKGPIGFSTIRGGDIVGDHSVLFAMDKERIEITHRADNRALFANGAISAAIWLFKQKAGLYNMEDVLNELNI